MGWQLLLLRIASPWTGGKCIYLVFYWWIVHFTVSRVWNNLFVIYKIPYDTNQYLFYLATIQSMLIPVWIDENRTDFRRCWTILEMNRQILSRSILSWKMCPSRSSKNIQYLDRPPVKEKHFLRTTSDLGTGCSPCVRFSKNVFAEYFMHNVTV